MRTNSPYHKDPLSDDSADRWANDESDAGGGGGAMGGGSFEWTDADRRRHERLTGLIREQASDLGRMRANAVYAPHGQASHPPSTVGFAARNPGISRR